MTTDLSYTTAGLYDEPPDFGNLPIAMPNGGRAKRKTTEQIVVNRSRPIGAGLQPPAWARHALWAVVLVLAIGVVVWVLVALFGGGV